MLGMALLSLASRRIVVLTLALGVGALALPASGSAAAVAVAVAPTVGTGGVSHVSFSSAILSGDVNAQGAAANYYFQYGTTSAYGSQTPLAPAGNGTITIKVSQTITGLLAATVYHYRVVAVSPSGTTVGGGRTFTTAKIPLSVQLVATPNPVVFGDSFYVEGTLSGTGAADHAIALQVNPFPYLRGFQTVGNLELTSATGGFSFPYLGLLENAQLRVVTVGSRRASAAAASSTRTTRSPLSRAVGARRQSRCGCTRRSARTRSAAARRWRCAGRSTSPERAMYSPHERESSSKPLS
jgi:hypothetical protein